LGGYTWAGGPLNSRLLLPSSFALSAKIVTFDLESFTLPNASQQGILVPYVQPLRFHLRVTASYLFIFYGGAPNLLPVII